MTLRDELTTTLTTRTFITHDNAFFSGEEDTIEKAKEAVRANTKVKIATAIKNVLGHQTYKAADQVVGMLMREQIIDLDSFIDDQTRLTAEIGPIQRPFLPPHMIKDLPWQEFPVAKFATRSGLHPTIEFWSREPFFCEQTRMYRYSTSARPRSRVGAHVCFREGIPLGPWCVPRPENI